MEIPGVLGSPGKYGNHLEKLTTDLAKTEKYFILLSGLKHLLPVIKNWLFKNHELSVPVALLVLCLATYGLLLPGLGIYWDDWPYTWYQHTYGAAGLQKALTEDRPFLSLIYIITGSLVGDSPMAWQIFNIIARWLLSLVFWWFLKLVWPNYSRQATWATLLFTVFPGFGQHWISTIFSRAYLIYSIFLLSFCLMIKATQQSGKKSTILIMISSALSAFNLLSTEYFYGLELMRPFYLWVVFNETRNKFIYRARKTLMAWLPYLATLIIYSVWRFFFFHSIHYDFDIITGIRTDPLMTMINIGTMTWYNLLYSMVWSWSEIFSLFSLPVEALSSQISLMLGLVFILITAIFLRIFSRQDTGQPVKHESSDDHWGSSAMILGLVAVVLGGLPFEIANLHVSLDFPQNRFLLTLMFGGSLFIAGLLEYFIKTRSRRMIILSIMIGLAVGYQFYVSNSFRRDWENQKQFLWQLTWRMPGLQPGTVLLTHQLPLIYYTDNSLSAAINWIYAPEHKSYEIPYFFIYMRTRLNNILPNLEPGTTLDIDYRAGVFKGSTSNSITIFSPAAGCLRVLDPIYTNLETFPDLSPWYYKSIPLSKINLIIANPDNPSAPPVQIVGQEPEHTWCFYFEKAELARQTGDWISAASLGDQARKKGYEPEIATEWMPFIEGYAQVGRVSDAAKLTQDVFRNSPDSVLGLCSIWQRLQAEKDLNAEVSTEANKLIIQLECSKNRKQS
jgi:hypothetical protein